MAKLGWSNYGDGSSVAWFEDGEEGAVIGQDFKTPTDQLEEKLKEARKESAEGNAAAREAIEYLVVELAAQKWVAEHPDVAEMGDGGLRLPEAPARALGDYMRTLKNALARAHDATPWPDWAVKAQAAGWKAPKGWKP